MYSAIKEVPIYPDERRRVELRLPTAITYKDPIIVIRQREDK